MTVGVDGCRAGWFAVAFEKGSPVELGVFPSLDRLLHRFEGARWILVDIPIGLRSGGPEPRRCDVEARRLLGHPRASSVFPAPCRPVLGAPGYAEANAMSRALTGKGLSRQAWGIVPKIREVDDLLRSEPRQRNTVREVHPELLFPALGAGAGGWGPPTVHSKRSEAGYRERLEILATHLPDAEALAREALGRYRRKDVARDDVLDALAAAITADLGRSGLSTVPTDPELDDEGLPMEMVYAEPREARTIPAVATT